MYLSQLLAALRHMVPARMLLPGLLCLVMTACGGGGGNPSPGPGSVGNPLVQTIPVRTLPFVNQALAMGDEPFSFAPAGITPGSALSYASSDPEVIRFTGDVANLKGVGTVLITMTEVATGRTATVTITVNRGAAGLRVKDLVTRAVGSYELIPLPVSSASDGALKYELTSVNFEGAGDPGLLTPMLEDNKFFPGAKPATGTITVTQEPTANFFGATVTATFTVLKGNTVITLPDGPNVPDRSTLFHSGSDAGRFRIQLTQAPQVLNVPPREDVSISIDNDAIADVSTEIDPDTRYIYGRYTPKRTGSAKITITAAGTEYMEGATRTVDLSIGQTIVPQGAVEMIGIEASPQYIHKYSFNASATPQFHLFICGSKSQHVLFRYAPDTTKGEVKVILSDGVVEHRLGDPANNYAPYIDYAGQRFYYGYEFPADIGKRDYTLRTEVAAWTDLGGTVFSPAQHRVYSLQTEQREYLPNGDTDRTCILSGSQ